ncbi:nuclease A inhibitor family protein [Gemmata sp. JC717]|uniref:nuclease A inhibitor family protein n=1 Tax=Gemmata algarum TaxID=2975278 RepID=UPI0021BA7ECE|nr:nuclease A inhibitor family protein [Gemmata algarum]MDY3556058.1 nuclease A inhibitor family protein [Gemmata algarum]
MAKQDPVLKELRSAAKGLLFPSETDAPLEAFAWPGGDGPPDEAAVRANAKVDAEVPVERLTLAELTRTIPDEGRGPFLPLFAVLAHHLSGAAVFKVGETEIDVYIVGRTTDGRYAGVKTKVVET